MSLLRAGLWLSAGIALGRFAGFIRDLILARRFGLGAEADVAVIALTLPDAILNVLIGSAMAAALIPALVARRQAGGAVAVDRLLGQMALLGLGLGTLLAAILAFDSGLLVRLLNPGLSPAQIGLAAPVIAVALWAIPLTVLSSVLAAGLQERERFAMTSLGTLWFNGAVIIGLLLWRGTLAAIAWAMLAGALLRLAGQAWEWRRAGGGWSWQRPWEPDRRLLIAYAQLLATGSAVVLLPIAGRWFASFRGEGAIAAWTYATRLADLPLQVLVTVFATALFPRFSSRWAQGDEAGARRYLHLGGQVVIVIATAVAVIAAGLAPQLVDVAFRLADPRVADAARWLFLGLPFAGLTALLQAWFAARRDTRTPLIVSAAGVAVFLAAGWPVLAVWGLPGLAVLVSAQQLAVCAVLLWRVRPAGLCLPAMTTAAVAVVGALVARLPGSPAAALLVGGGAGMLALAAGLATIPDLRLELLRRMRRAGTGGPT